MKIWVYVEEDELWRANQLGTNSGEDKIVEPSEPGTVYYLKELKPPGFYGARFARAQADSSWFRGPEFAIFPVEGKPLHVG
jgi:hypothetical protein